MLCCRWPYVVEFPLACRYRTKALVLKRPGRLLTAVGLKNPPSWGGGTMLYMNLFTCFVYYLLALSIIYLLYLFFTCFIYFVPALYVFTAFTLSYNLHVNTII